MRNSKDTQRILERKHLVVFGAGYVGGAVATKAAKFGARVTVLTRNPQKAAALVSEGCEAVVADLAEPSWHGDISSADFVLNAVSSGGGGIEGYRQSYLEGARSISEWASKCRGDAHLIYTGSTSVYPQGEGQEIDESFAAQGTEERTDILVQTEEKMGNWPYRSTILRLAGIYGPGRHYLLDQLKRGESVLPGSGDHRLNLIHLDDIVQAIFAVWMNPSIDRQSVYNVADNGATPKADVVDWIAQQLQKPIPTFSGLTVPGRRLNRPDRIIVNSKLKRETAWSPAYPTFREGYTAILGA